MPLMESSGFLVRHFTYRADKEGGNKNVLRVCREQGIFTFFVYNFSLKLYEYLTRTLAQLVEQRSFIQGFENECLLSTNALFNRRYVVEVARWS